MRRVIYQALLGAPFKIAGAVSTVAGIVGSVWPDKVKDMIGNGLPIQGISIALLVLAAVYFLLLWLLKPGERDEGHGTTQTSSGPNSPNMAGTFHAPITNVFNPPTPPVQERKDPLPRPESRGYPAGLATLRIDPKPDLDLTELLARVYEILGQPPIWEAQQKKFWEHVDLEIADKVSQNELHVWGRVGKKPLTLIDLGTWNDSTFDHREKSLHVPTPFSSGYEITDLRFYRAEIDKHWPKPIEHTPETIARQGRSNAAATKPKSAPKETEKPLLSGAQRGACKAALIEISKFLTGDVAMLQHDLAVAAKSEKLSKLIPQLDRFRVNAGNARIGAKGLQQRHALAVQLMGGRPDLGRLANALGDLSTKISQVKEGVSSGWPHEAVMECVGPMQVKNLEVGRVARRLKKQAEENEAEYLG